MSRSKFLTVLGLTFLACGTVGDALAATALPAPPAGASARFPAPDCEARVGYDRDMVLRGYLIAKGTGPTECVPFTSTAVRPPTAGYAGDFYVDEFSDARLRDRWAACKADRVCNARVGTPISKRIPPNREYGMTDPLARYLLGKVAEAGVLDLRTIRRPAFFAAKPYEEAVARSDQQAYIVEFTAPAEPYERIHANRHDDVKLRGWYVRGDGIADGKGGKLRALVIMSAGGGGRLTAIDDPADHLYHNDPRTATTVLGDFPNATTGSPGQRDWRWHIQLLHQAGFDVLSYDRRGVGVSSGFSDINTLQQGRDLLAVIADIGTGDGMRALDPSGAVHAGRDAASLLTAGAPGSGMPILLLGSSRGTMSVGWAMARNFDKACDYDLPAMPCTPAAGNMNIKGAILISEFSSGVGYTPAEMTGNDESRGLGRDRGLFVAGSEVENNIVFFPSSAILASVSKWPAAFYARGLWDYAASLEGTIASYDRVQGLKELVVVRGPHPYETWPAVEKERVSERMVAFARAAVLGQKEVPGGRPWTTMKDLAATASDVWEASSQPLP